jgi:antitoxin component of MazEF toxin-antitoxin module
MTTVLSQKGQIELPGSLIRQLHLHAGDDLEISIEDEDTITLRKVAHPPNRGLVDLLTLCPAPFQIPTREGDSSPPLSL